MGQEITYEQAKDLVQRDVAFVIEGNKVVFKSGETCTNHHKEITTEMIQDHFESLRGIRIQQNPQLIDALTGQLKKRKRGELTPIENMEVEEAFPDESWGDTTTQVHTKTLFCREGLWYETPEGGFDSAFQIEWREEDEWGDWTIKWTRLRKVA